MNAMLLWFILALAGFGLFFLIRMVLRPIISHFINGALSKEYLDFIQKNARFQIAAAYDDSNADRANAQLVFAKIEEMGNPRVPYSKREQNLKYIKAYALINRKLSEELIKVLPKQQRNLEFQAKLATYICEVLTKLKEDTGTERNNVPEPVNHLFVEAWSFAVSAWLAGTLFFGFSMLTWDNLPVFMVGIFNLVLFGLMLIPLFRLIFTGFAKLTGVVTIATIIVVSMGLFAQTSHSLQLRQEIDLDKYNAPGKLKLTYPLWISHNATDQCLQSTHLSFLVEQPNVEAVSFDIPSGIQIEVKDEKCLDRNPSFDLSQQPSKAITFYLAPLDPASFDNSQITIIPKITISGKEILLGEDSFKITLEHWIWGLVSSLSLQLGSASATGILILLKVFVFNKPQF